MASVVESFTMMAIDCPACRRRMVIELERGDLQPTKGDYAICPGCYRVLCFNADLSCHLAETIPQVVEAARRVSKAQNAQNN